MKPSPKKATLLALALAMGVVSAQSNAALVVNVNVNAVPVDAQSYFKQAIESKYHAKTNDQIILPLDIADIPIVKGSLISKPNSLPNLRKSNDKKLTQYLGQNQQAGSLFNKYQLRLAALNEGQAPQDLTLEHALNQEALFKFLDIQVTPQTISTELVQYLKARGLDSNELGALDQWAKRFAQTQGLVDTVSGAIASEQNNTYNRK